MKIRKTTPHGTLQFTARRGVCSVLLFPDDATEAWDSRVLTVGVIPRETYARFDRYYRLAWQNISPLNAGSHQEAMKNFTLKGRKP